MTSRERRFVIIGAVVVPAVFLFLFVGRPLLERMNEAGADGASLREAFQAFRKDVETRDLMGNEIETRAKNLNVTLSRGPEEEQVRDFKKAIEDAGKKSKVKISSFVPRKRTGLARKAGSTESAKRTFNISFQTTQGGLVGFLKSLDALGKPVVIGSIDIQGTEGKDALRVGLEFYTYLFTETSK